MNCVLAFYVYVLPFGVIINDDDDDDDDDVDNYNYYN